MKKLSKILLLSVLSIFLVAGSAMAVPFNSNRPLTLGTPWPGEDSLQQVFDNTFGLGVMDAYNDQSDAAIWIPAEAAMDAYAITFLTATTGTLGIYSDTTGLTHNFNLGADYAVDFAIDGTGDLWVDGSEVVTGFGNSFGFYYISPYGMGTGYTEDDMNLWGFGLAGNILALSYLVPDGTSAFLPLYLGGTTVNLSGDNDWVIAFEDGSDGDFQDAVYLVEDINPVPEPATMLLLGSGLIGLAAFSRKKFFKK